MNSSSEHSGQSTGLAVTPGSVGPQFTVHSFKEWPGSPATVPWSFMAPHARQAESNHGQTLERLDERGGCCPCEIVAIVEGRNWHRMPHEEATRRLNELLSQNTKVSQMHKTSDSKHP